MAKSKTFTSADILTPEIMNALTQDSQIVASSSTTSNDNSIATTAWVRQATGNTALNAATATNATTATTATNSTQLGGIAASSYVTLTGTQELTNKTYNGYTLAAACAKGVADSSSASALTSTGTNLVTERDVYYGIPTINLSKTYNSSTTIFAPTAGGTSGYVLKSNGSSASPSWIAQSDLIAGRTVATLWTGAVEFPASVGLMNITGLPDNAKDYNLYFMVFKNSNGHLAVMPWVKGQPYSTATLTSIQQYNVRIYVDTINSGVGFYSDSTNMWFTYTVNRFSLTTTPAITSATPAISLIGIYAI